ncbi:MAG: Na(+)/H(+) antiporter subunit D, partial [Gammaproteobacteria bacterium]|nr:Na(+)/H(+) antiporter subunit D [Gammaproteobacteria bacterium]
MINAPFLILFAGAAISWFFPAALRKPVLLIFPVVGLLNLIALDPSQSWTVSLFDVELTLFALDRLSFIFGVLFHIAAIIGLVFAWHVEDRPQHLASLLYPGSALGVVFAGDFLTMFVFWECLALSSVFFITARGTERASRAAIRYLVIQVVSGVLLLTGALFL